MKYVRLGSTGLQVSPLCLGCMTYGTPERGTHPWSLEAPYVPRTVAGYR